MSDEHLDDRAALYALGALDAGEADRVNAHAARCVACAKLVGEAERAVSTLAWASVPHVDAPAELEGRIAAIERIVPLRRPRVLPVRTFARWAALAASVLVVLGGAAVGTRDVLHMHETIAQDDEALAALANSHFKHAMLTKIDQIGAVEQRRGRLGHEDLTAVPHRHHTRRPIQRRSEVIVAPLLRLTHTGLLPPSEAFILEMVMRIVEAHRVLMNSARLFCNGAGARKLTDP